MSTLHDNTDFMEAARREQERLDRLAAVADILAITSVSMLAGCAVVAALTWPIIGVLLSCLVVGAAVGAFVAWIVGCRP